MALTVTEDWICERVQLKHDNHDDVRSLSLPGTYHEKITYLGHAFRNFRRLKHLDLSRNALISLEGIDHLKILEKLNLYYNNIPTLKELYRLRFNTSLQELDLRLNPVTKDEPDYRLFLVHMLPNLRKLDDRDVRDSERKAALTHFTPDQATELTEHPALPNPEEERQPHPRAEYVKSIGKKSTVLDDDDCEVLDLISRTAGDLGKPRQITGSYAKLPSVEEHAIEDARVLDRAEMMSDAHPYDVRNHLPSTNFPPSPIMTSSLKKDEEPVGNHGNYQSRQIYNQPHSPSKISHHQAHRERMRVQFADEVEQIRKEGDPNIRFGDESKAYTAYTSKANFTPAPQGSLTEIDRKTPMHSQPVRHTDNPTVPSSASHGRDASQSDSRIMLSDVPMSPPTRQRGEPRQLRSTESTIDDVQNISLGEDKDFFEKFLTLVDKYWNGSKSLHKNAKFLNLAKTMLSNHMSDMNTSGITNIDKLKEDLAHFAQENVALRGKLSRVNSSDQGQGNREMKSALDQAYRDLDLLRSRLHQSMEENQRLKSEISSHGSLMASNNAMESKQIGDLSRENELLKQDIERLNVQTKHYSQLQELANMLQESHKSLVSTNDHLLKELSETRSRHSQEVKQLHMSYGELKKTLDWVPHHGGSGSNSNGVGYDNYDIE
uniref:Centrosomal protein of 72 kDa-like isoform X2 n=1 Tax=Saccoglossus kowalevskii TaxID=10224 RepID=A0ABM0MYP2_SACKO|nr:PREDICTED: centrosomal protein of 72 kDa-like isoform X2 [Saccoglossus kowalevskii]